MAENLIFSSPVVVEISPQLVLRTALIDKHKFTTPKVRRVLFPFFGF